MMSSIVSKVVQPTATVTSVPVCGPSKYNLQLAFSPCRLMVTVFAATGIARSVSPGQSLRATPVQSPQTVLDPAAPQVTDSKVQWDY